MRTKKAVSDELALKAGRLAEIKAMPDDDITAEVIAEGKGLGSDIKALQVELKGFDEFAAVRTAADEADEYVRQVRRPAVGAAAAQAAPIPGSGGEVKARVEPAASEDDKFLRRGPFKSFSHYCHALRQQGGQTPGMVNYGVLGEWNGRIEKIDRAIKGWSDDMKAATGMSEFSDPEGASFVPVEFSQIIWERVQQPQLNLIARVDSTPVGGNTLIIRAWQDKSRTNFSLYGGSVAYWRAEAGQMSSTKPSTRDITLKLNELYVFYYATDELLVDAPALSAELTKVAAASLTAKINDAIVNGSGVGQPLGIMNSPAKITATAVSGQGANTIVASNIDAMWGRRNPNFQGLWLYNLDCEPQFPQLNYTSTKTNTAYNAAWVYVPQGGLSGKNYDTLKGREMVETEYCQALGTEGDIVLFDPTQYKAIIKSTGIDNAVSMHLRFDYGETAFRWTFRMDGRPMWEAPLTPARGGNTRSPIVTLSSTRT